MSKLNLGTLGMCMFLAGVLSSALGLESWVIHFFPVLLSLSVVWAVLRREFHIPVALGFFWLGILRHGAGSFSFEYVEPVTSLLEQYTHLFVSHIEQTLPEPHASYLAGILVGLRSNIPYELKQDFIATGTMHITALSGYNVSIIARCLQLIFKNAFWSVFGIMLFVLATGASSSVVRAALMGSLLVLSSKSGRQYFPLYALLVAVFFMVFFTPHILLEDIGFQLSVMATLGIILLPRYVERGCTWLTERFQLRETLVVTLSAQIATLPIVLYYFHAFSFISPIVNMLVLPTIPPVMFFGALVGVFGFLPRMFVTVLAWPAYLLLSYQIYIVQLFARFTR